MQGAHILALLAVLILPACGPRTKKNKRAALQKAALSISEIQTQIDVDQSVVELEAKLTDIPTALGSRISFINQVSEQPHQLRVTFECTQSLSELDAFYAEQMADHGWQSMAQIPGDQVMQIYKKPSKICVVTIRQIASDKREVALIISEIQVEI